MATIKLLEYQKRYIADKSRFVFWAASVQIGKSFTSSLKHVLRRLERPGLSILLSASERQSLELMEKVKMHSRGAAVVEPGFFEGTSIQQHTAKYANGSRIIALPANPDTARGYSGDVLLDEFAIHRDSRAIWAAMFGRATRGYSIDVLSTFKGTDNKFFEIGRTLGLHTGVRPERQPVRVGEWSGHWTDIYLAREEGLKVNIDQLRAALGDEEVFAQEYCCVPMAGGDEYIPLELILACESPEASVEWDGRPLPGLSAGYDVARSRDLSVIAIGRPVGPLAIVRGMIWMPRMKFAEQKSICREVAAAVQESGGRFAMDATGIGAQLGEELHDEFGCVEPVNFASTVETGAQDDQGRPIRQLVKNRLAELLKRRFEDRMIWLPESPVLRRSIQAVKRYVAPTGAVRLDAVRTGQGHADEFWAMALMCGAMEGPRTYVPLSEGALLGRPVAAGMMEAVF